MTETSPNSNAADASCAKGRLEGHPLVNAFALAHLDINVPSR